jgi:general secretion pathway protein L
LAEDTQRLERWQQAMQAQGLQLAHEAGGRLRISSGTAP